MQSAAQSSANTEVNSPIGCLYGCADSGEVITAEELSKRRAERDPTAAFYFASLGEGLFIDAERRGSYARFANHSCEPNCALEKWTVGHEPRLVLVAMRDIPKLTELCYNYNAGGGVADITHAQRCRCGAQHCSGTIGARRKAPIKSEIDVTEDDSGSAKRRKAKSAGKQATAGRGNKRSRAPELPLKPARSVPAKRLRGNADGPMSERKRVQGTTLTFCVGMVWARDTLRALCGVDAPKDAPLELASRLDPAVRRAQARSGDKELHCFCRLPEDIQMPMSRGQVHRRKAEM